MTAFSHHPKVIRRSIPVSEYDIVIEKIVKTTDFKLLRNTVFSLTLNEERLRNFGMKEMHKLQAQQHATEQDIEGRLHLSRKRQTSKKDYKIGAASVKTKNVHLGVIVIRNISNSQNNEHVVEIVLAENWTK